MCIPELFIPRQFNTKLKREVLQFVIIGIVPIAVEYPETYFNIRQVQKF